MNSGSQWLSCPRNFRMILNPCSAFTCHIEPHSTTRHISSLPATLPADGLPLSPRPEIFFWKETVLPKLNLSPWSGLCLILCSIVQLLPPLMSTLKDRVSYGVSSCSHWGFWCNFIAFQSLPLHRPASLSFCHKFCWKLCYKGVYPKLDSVSVSFRFKPKTNLFAAAATRSLQSCPTLCDRTDGSPPGLPVPGILQQEHWSGLPFPSPIHESEKWKWSRSVVSDSWWSHGPTRLLCPWDSPGKSSGVGCHCLLRRQTYLITFYIMLKFSDLQYLHVQIYCFFLLCS